MVSLCSLKLISLTPMVKPLFNKCRRFFPDLPEHVFRNLMLVCSAIVLARSTNLNVLKDYLPQLLDNDRTKADSHYKRLIAAATRPLLQTGKAQSVSHWHPSIRFSTLPKPLHSYDLGRHNLAGWTETNSLANLVHYLSGYRYPHLLMVGRRRFNSIRRVIAARWNDNN